MIAILGLPRLGWMHKRNKNDVLSRLVHDNNLYHEWSRNGNGRQRGLKHLRFDPRVPANPTLDAA